MEIMKEECLKIECESEKVEIAKMNATTENKNATHRFIIETNATEPAPFKPRLRWGVCDECYYRSHDENDRETDPNDEIMCVDCCDDVLEGDARVDADENWRMEILKKNKIAFCSIKLEDDELATLESDKDFAN